MWNKIIRAFENEGKSFYGRESEIPLMLHLQIVLIESSSLYT